MDTIIHTFLHKQINWGYSFMTSTKRREVTKIWGILQIAGDIFFFGGGAGVNGGVGDSFFSIICKVLFYSPIPWKHRIFREKSKQQLPVMV